MKKLALALLLLAPGLAHADVKSDLAKIDAAQDACVDKAGTVDSEMEFCAAQAYEAADKVLNAAYNNLLGNLQKQKRDAEYRNRIVASEKAWIAYRDADSSAQGLPNLGGTGENLNVEATLYSMTKDRALEIDQLASAIFN